MFSPTRWVLRRALLRGSAWAEASRCGRSGQISGKGRRRRRFHLLLAYRVGRFTIAPPDVYRRANVGRVRAGSFGILNTEGIYIVNSERVYEFLSGV